MKFVANPSERIPLKVPGFWSKVMSSVHKYRGHEADTETLRFCPHMLRCTVLEVLILQKDSIFPEATAKFLLNDNLRLLPGHFGFLISKDQQERRGITFMAGVIDSDHQREIRLLKHNGSQEGIHVGFR